MGASLVVLAVVMLPGMAGCSRPGVANRGGGPMAIQVVAVPVREQALTETVSLAGSVTPNEMIEVKSETDGVVEEIGFVEGQRVEKGRLLLALDESKFKAAVAEADANFKLAQTSFERMKQLLRDRLISQQEYDQAGATFAMNEAALALKQRQWKDSRVFAPFSGMTGARQISPGQVISRNTTLTWLVDLDTVKVEVEVPEAYLSQVQPGQSLEFSVAAFPGERFRGEVYFVSPQLKENNRTALVKARVENRGLKLRGGMYASLDLSLERRARALVIPEPAIMNEGDTFSVFVVDGKTNAAVRPVVVGLRLAGRVEVTKGLSAGEMVVVEGVQKLRPGAPVRFGPPESAAPYLN